MEALEVIRGTTPATGSVEVRIRQGFDASGAFLCYWPIAELDVLLRHLGKWSVQTEQGAYLGAAFDGQFELYAGEVCFEVICTGDPA